MKIKFTIPDSVNAKLKGMVSRGISALEVDENGHLIITLSDHTVQDLGKVSGDDGVSCTHEWDGTVLRVTSASGTSEADLKGDKGNKGDKGDKPKRGTDYWTEADKAELVNRVLSELAVEVWTFTLTDGTTVEKEVPLL